MKRFAIGSYTSPQGHAPDARGKGVSIIKIERSGKLDQLEELSVYGDLENPSYLTWGKSRPLLYAASEMGSSPGRVDVFSLSESADIIHMSGCGGNEKDACHISLSPDGSGLYTASYGSGRISGFSLDDKGYPELTGTISYEGSGPNKARQEGPHAHQIVPSPHSDHLYVCDLGTDTIWLHNRGPRSFANEKNQPLRALKLPDGYGPRHLAFDDRSPVAYILCELVPRILTVRINGEDGKLEILQDIPSTSEGRNSSQPIAPAAIKIHPSGKALAVSNRFRDTIAVFQINRHGDSAELSFSGEFNCGGKTPRDMEFDEEGSLLLIANQDSSNISSLRFDPDTGLCDGKPGPGMKTGSPVCIVRLS